MQYIVSIDPGYRNMGLSVISAKSDSPPPVSPSAKKNPSIQVLHLSVIDLQGEDQRKQKNLKKSTGCTGNWDTMKLKLALDCAFEKIPVGATTHCIIELQGVMKNAGSIGIHEVIGAGRTRRSFAVLDIGEPKLHVTSLATSRMPAP